MKKFLLVLMSVCILAAVVSVKAQTFSMADTVYATVTSGANVYDRITNNTAAGLTVKYHVVTPTTFPADWLVDTALGICDNNICRQNTGAQLWNASTSSGTLFTSAAYNPGPGGDFHLVLNLAGASNGTHILTVNVTDINFGGTSKNVVFIISKVPAEVPNVAANLNNISLYPNPARDEINLVYDAGLEVNNVAIYNIIGKVMSVYKVSGNSANLSLENMPAGIYFVRLVNAQGNIVATRKFTKQ